MSSVERAQLTMRVKNERPNATTLTIEPWGEQTRIAAEGAVTLACAGPVGGRVELVVQERGLVVYGWPGSVIEVVSPDK